MFELVIRVINIMIIAAFVGCFSYQFIYFVVRYKKKIQIPTVSERKKYAVLIAARNEERVLGGLIDSIQSQSYPSELLDIYVIADNCTDRTAEIARWKGVTCYERQNKEQVGKGYALQYLLNRMSEDSVLEAYDGFFVFDADNILRRDYVEQMNQTFCTGYHVVTSYRNSKNFDDNWISFGYGLWFLHEAELLNKGRMTFGSSCMVSGTGYLISREVVERNQGWKFFLLTEDIEFTADCILHDIKIGYCPMAEFYDEQPVRLIDSWNQRIRWIKGYYQVFGKYGKALARKVVREKCFSAYDMLMGYLPAMVLTSFASVFGIVQLVVSIATSQSLGFTIFTFLMYAISTFSAMLILGIYTAVSQRKNIHCSTGKMIGYLVLFPIYMYTYFPIAIAAMKPKVEWKPMQHGQNKKEPQGIVFRVQNTR